MFDEEGPAEKTLGAAEAFRAAVEDEDCGEEDEICGEEEEIGDSDPVTSPDREEAEICLSCRQLRCFLDDNLPCLPYGRAMRALRILRGERNGTPAEGGSA